MTTAVRTLNPVETGAATVIARKCSSRAGIQIVLCFLGLDHPTPYVTWLEYKDGVDGSTQYQSGHYFYEGEIANAVKDLKERD